MSQINPFTHAFIQGMQAQRQIVAAKDRQTRHDQITERDSATWSDELEHQVESSEEVVQAPDHADHENRKGKKNRKLMKPEDDADGESHLDLTA